MKTEENDKWQFWIDRGGTFTDLVGRMPDGRLITHKLLSENPEQYKDAAIQGIREMMGIQSESAIPSHQISCVKMGTTVATNALLERQGVRTVLVITKGFGDALRIGYQNRPNIFKRSIELPELLHEKVIELNERIDANGKIILPLNVDEVNTKLQRVFNDGIKSVAIVLLHGYRFHDHENQVAEIASKIGYTQISISHQASPLMKLVSRGDTTVVDAYLSPVLRRYVNQVESSLAKNEHEKVRLMFMQSNGGLADAKVFQGKDAILSGPAGGVVGMCRTAELSKITKLIGFDMGGTSTDVTHFNGEFERIFETQVSGVRIRAPMMHIHTVAAGGGSILNFDGTRYRVGPKSAGANPGPACYKRGGPLTVTDCNVMLGKLQPKYFPKVFGENADQPLDKEIVEKKFNSIAQAVATARNEPIKSSAEIAEGFLRIAIENMANAIKEISVRRGYDIMDYTLNCFGGAGGQHACLVADLLGIEKIFIHPFAGVLSALGMGLADINVMLEQQIEQILEEGIEKKLEPDIQDLEAKATNQVFQQGVAIENIYTIRKVAIRYEGTDSAILINVNESDKMSSDFEKKHLQRFGFIASDRKMIIETLSIEAVGKAQSILNSQVEKHNNVGKPDPLDQVEIYFNNKWNQAQLYDRELLLPGQTTFGPAIIIEKSGTVVVENGWKAYVDNYHNLILSRHLERAISEAVGTKADPVMLEVFNNLFMSIANQMGATLSNTAYSVNIKERLDFSCAIFDSRGNLVANAPHVPVHLGSMSESVKEVINRNQDLIKPGNVYVVNDPYKGGTHLPDITVVTPVFDEANHKILFYLASRGHHADIGGLTPGSSPPDSKHINEEGILIDNYLIVEEGRFREQETRSLLSSGEYPCRNIEQNIQDLLAQVAANQTGYQELHKMIKHFGVKVVNAYMQHVQDNAEEAVRRVIDVLKNGSFINNLDNGLKIVVTITVDHKQREAHIDFTGTSKQSDGNYNAPVAVCKSAVLYVFRTLVDDDIPLNSGCLKPLKITIPKKSMVNPEYPAAVVAGNTEVSQAITDTLYGALGIMAASQGTMNNFVYGNQKYQNYETICGGTGAGIDHNGTSAVHSHMTNTRMTDPEVLEWRYPIRVEEFSIRKGSGGKGEYNGGDGVIRKIRFLESMTATILSSRRLTFPHGLNGGANGVKGENYIIRKNEKVELLKGNDKTLMNTDDVFVIETPGGGGFGLSTDNT